MPVPRPFVLVASPDQWLRASFDSTALKQNIVSLAWKDASSKGSSGGTAPPGAGLAFDCQCRLYHSVPEQNRVERVLWAAEDPLRPSAEPLETMNLFAAKEVVNYGEFHSLSAAPSLSDPRGLCVDSENRLFIAEHGNRRILIFDLESRRLLRAVPLAGQPSALASHDRTVYATLEDPPAVIRLDARRGPRPVPLPKDFALPARLAFAPDGAPWILNKAGLADASVFPLDNPDHGFTASFATDIAFLGDSATPILVLARMPGDDFLCYGLGKPAREEMPSLTATDYDGRGIVSTPGGRLAYWTATGLRYAVAARLKYYTSGSVTTYQLDSGSFYTTWGRIFLDACIPAGTDLRINCVAVDELPPDAPMPRKPPANIEPPTILRLDLSPMIPASLASGIGGDGYPVYRRDTGPETPWVRFAADDTFRTYEAPILCGPGRYLCVSINFTGNSHFTPRLRSLRAEYPAHDYLRRLPKVYSRDERVANFLLHYLAMFEGELGDWEARSISRRALIEARSAPAEILPWLAGFLGLVLDERWSVTVRRQVIAEATWLFRFRGTLPGLQRFLEICTQGPVVIVEKFRLRGLGDTLLGDQAAVNSILGAGFRVGGAVGDPSIHLLGSNSDSSSQDPFETHAHRFTVMIQKSLSSEQLDMVQHLLDVHRPAHTLVEVCTVGAGIRVGRGLLIGLTSMIGRSEGFTRLQLGGSVLGRGVVLGQAGAGAVPGASILGADSHVG